MASYRPSKNIVLLGLTSLFNDASSEMIRSVLPAFFLSVLRAGASSLGLVEGLANGVSNLMQLYSGRLSDRWQKRKLFVVLGYALAVAARPFYLLVRSVAGVAGLFITDRIGRGLRDSPRDAMLSLSTSREATGRAFGFHRAFDTLGSIIGPLVAYLILRAHPSGFHTIFITAFFAGFLAVASVLLVKDVAGKVRRERRTLSSFIAFSPDFKRYLAALLFLSLGSIPVAVLLLTTQHLGLALASIPLFYLIYNLSYASFSFPAGKLSDRAGAKRVITIGYLVLIAGYALLAVSEHVALLVISFLVLGLFPALTDGVQRALASELSTEGRRGSALGYVNAISGIGLLLAGIGGGYVWQTFGLGPALALGSALILVGLVILSGIARRSPGAPQTSPSSE